VEIPGADGYFGVLPGHTPLLAVLGAGELWYRQRQEKHYLAIAFGFAEVQAERVTILAQVAEKAEEIDAARATAAKARAEERLARQALHDPLTGLPNRALVVERLRYVTDRRPARSETAVMFLDVDRFKLLNDSLGHDAGDQLLVELGRRLRAEVRPSDLVARFGGDEFVIVCDQLNGPHAARHVARRVLDVVQQPFELGSSNVVVTASIGVAFANGGDPTSLLRDADTAMYFAKERGRARIELFDERLRIQAVERLSVEGGLRSACSLGQLVMYYQPAISLHSGDVVGFEALLRWRHPDLGLLEPERFLAIAEETGLIQPIGEWALEETCRQAMRWRAAHPEWGPLRFGVNLSAGQVADRTLSGGVERILRTTGMPAELVSFEITENVLLEDTSAAERGLLALRAHGVHLALDDFGTSYSSLAQLKRFPIQTLKIDGSFIHGLLAEPDDEAIVRSVVNLARMLGLVTVAEGVEKREQADRLRVLGCDLAQGHLWSTPRPPDEIEGLFAGKRAPLRISDPIN
jgi:diguanylate cyclase (GGDEF)-like protein